jgi:hypothetical protein
MKKNSGFSLAEIIMYTALVAILLFVVINVLIFGLSVYHRFDAARDVQDAAVAVIERIVSESRNASSISIDASGSGDAGQDILTMYNSSNNQLAKFVIETNTTTGNLVVNLYNGSGVLVGPLTPSNVSAAGSYFRIASSTSEAQLARVVLVLRAGEGDDELTQRFYTSAIPRGSYSQ